MLPKPVPIGEQVQFVRHGAFNRALGACLAVDQTAAGTMLYVIGPSGVGKTELSKMIGPILYGHSTHGRQLPYVRVSLENPSGGYFSSKSMTRDILAQFKDPFRGMELLPEDLPPDMAASVGRALGLIGRQRDQSEETMRKIVISMSRVLGSRLLVLDEVNMMVLIKRGRPLESHLESIRTLGQKMGVRTVLLGTFAALMFMGYSAQMNRVSINVHFDRIRDDTEEGMCEFLTLLDQFEQDLQLSDGLLIKNADALYDATYGISGELIALLERARMNAVVARQNDITLCNLEAAYPFESVKRRMREETDFVEAIMNGKPFDPRDMVALLKERGRLMSEAA